MNKRLILGWIMSAGLVTATSLGIACYEVGMERFVYVMLKLSVLVFIFAIVLRGILIVLEETTGKQQEEWQEEQKRRREDMAMLMNKRNGFIVEIPTPYQRRKY